MFKDHDENFTQQEGDTVIGGSIKIEGDLSSQGNIIVEGQVVGSVKTEKNLMVGQQAKVDAEVNAGEANVSGEVNGNMNIAQRLELKSSAKVNGDIKTKILKVEEGAVINGRVEMEGGTVVEVKDMPEEEPKGKKDKKQNEDEVDF